MTDELAVAGPRRVPKAERLLALAREEYEPRRATRWPYLLRGGERFRFEGADRRRLLADLRAVWRERFPGQAAQVIGHRAEIPSGRCSLAGEFATPGRTQVRHQPPSVRPLEPKSLITTHQVRPPGSPARLVLLARQR